MYKLCKTEQSAQRQRELERTLCDMMLSRQYEEIGVSDFCAYASIPRKAFYRYFSSKDGALHALVDHTIMEHESFRMPYLPENSHGLVRELEVFFRFWKEQKPLLDALQFSGMNSVLLERSIAYMEQVSLSKGLIPGENEFTQRQFVRFAMSGLMTMMVKWHNDGFRESVREMAELAARILSSGLAGYIRELI